MSIIVYYSYHLSTTFVILVRPVAATPCPAMLYSARNCFAGGSGMSPARSIRRRKSLLANNLRKWACGRGFERQSHGAEIINAWRRLWNLHS